MYLGVGRAVRASGLTYTPIARGAAPTTAQEQSAA
jgi:hypothetical protein